MSLTGVSTTLAVSNVNFGRTNLVGTDKVLNAHLPALDGLRAIAIILVLMYHLTPGHNSGQGMKAMFFKLADIGWTGVDLFFVLSGFLITNMLLRAKSTSQPLQRFAIGRILRIAPAYCTALCVAFFAVPLAFGIYQVPPISQQAPYWLYASNYFPLSEPFLDGRLRLDHFWSLAVEMQFYIVWPLVIYHFRSRTVLWLGLVTLLSIVVARSVAVAVDAHWTVDFGWMPLRMSGLIVGSLIALGVQAGLQYSRVQAVVVVTIFAGFAFALLVSWFGKAGVVFKPDNTGLDLVLRTTLPVAMSVFYGAVLLLSLQGTIASRALGHPVFKPLARYSYGIYVYHFLLAPIFVATFGPPMLASITGGEDLPIYLYFVLSSAISFLLALASYHLVEVHFLRAKLKLATMSAAV